jgi:hypothetical protein
VPLHPGTWPEFVHGPPNRVLCLRNGGKQDEYRRRGSSSELIQVVSKFMPHHVTRVSPSITHQRLLALWRREARPWAASAHSHIYNKKKCRQRYTTSGWWRCDVIIKHGIVTQNLLVLKPKHAVSALVSLIMLVFPYSPNPSPKR